MVGLGDLYQKTGFFLAEHVYLKLCEDHHHVHHPFYKWDELLQVLVDDYLDLQEIKWLEEMRASVWEAGVGKRRLLPLLKLIIRVYKRKRHRKRWMTWRVLIIVLREVFHTFSAFWLRSSVVSVLNCVNAVKVPAGGLTVHTNFLRVALSLPQDLVVLQSP